MIRKSSLLPLAIALTTVFAMPSAFAQTASKAASTAKLPSAEKVLNDFTAATGGREAMKKVKTMVTIGTIEITSANISGTMESRIKMPNKVWVKQDIKGIGTAVTAYDGKAGWSIDPINGTRTLSGPELSQLQSSIDDSKNDWHDRFSGATMIGIRKVGTQTTYAIRLTARRADLKAVVNFYDVKTKLLVRTDVVQEGPTGSVPTQNFLSDYRTVQGTKQPFSIRSVSGKLEVLTRITSIQFNVPIDDSTFAKPEASAASAAK